MCYSEVVEWDKAYQPNSECFLRAVFFRGGARGGLGGYSPPLEHASPLSEGETRFFGDF